MIMSIGTWIILAVTLVGLLLWIVSDKPKANEVGKIMFTYGLIAFLLCLCGGAGIRIGRG